MFLNSELFMSNWDLGLECQGLCFSVWSDFPRFAVRAKNSLNDIAASRASWAAQRSRIYFAGPWYLKPGFPSTYKRGKFNYSKLSKFVKTDKPLRLQDKWITPQNKCKATNKKWEYKSTQLHVLEKIVILPHWDQLFCCYIYTVYCIPLIGEPEEGLHEVVNSHGGRSAKTLLSF